MTPVVKYFMIACGGMNYAVAMMAGVELPIRCYPLQAMVTQPVKPWLHTLVSSVSLHTYLVQSSRGVQAIREGHWKFIPELGSGRFSRPARVAEVLPVRPQAHGAPRDALGRRRRVGQ